MYKYMLNSAVKLSMMFAKYFAYYTIILRGRFFVDTLYVGACIILICLVLVTKAARMKQNQLSFKLNALIFDTCLYTSFFWE